MKAIQLPYKLYLLSLHRALCDARDLYHAGKLHELDEFKQKHSTLRKYIARALRATR